MDTPGWSVHPIDKTKTSYGPMMDNIANQPLTIMVGAFQGCKQLKIAPEIPDTVTFMVGAFDGCESLEVAPVLPSGVTDMDFAFHSCKSLVEAPVIPAKVKSLIATFINCESLKTYAGSTDADGDFSNYVIPSGVTDMTGTFDDCILMTKAPALPSGVTNLDSTFSGCNALVVAPIIPQGVENMVETFWSCDLLKTYTGSTDADGNFSNYRIPNTVTNMNRTFGHCYSLTVAPKIPQGVENMGGTFFYCTKLKEAPAIPDTVTNVSETFAYCRAITKDIVIPCRFKDQITYYSGCDSTVKYNHPNDCSHRTTILFVSGLANGCSGGDIKFNANYYRGIAVCAGGDKAGVCDYGGDYYPISVPSGATSVTVNCPDNIQWGFCGFNLSDANKYTFDVDSGWRESGTYTFAVGSAEYATFSFKKTNGSGVTSSDLSNITITFNS